MQCVRQVAARAASAGSQRGVMAASENMVNKFTKLSNGSFRRCTLKCYLNNISRTVFRGHLRSNGSFGLIGTSA